MNSKIEAAINTLGERGIVATGFRHMGKDWYEIDLREHIITRYGGSYANVSLGPRMLATPQEMEELADCVYTPEELKELFLKRRAEEREANIG